MTENSGTDVLKRIMDYCAKAERYSGEVLEKLRSWNVEEEKSNEILDILRHEKFLDDQRYIRSYISEKWKLDHWGKVKIEYGLKQKGFVEYDIQSGLETIDSDEYRSAIHLALFKKRNELKPLNSPVLARKLLSFGTGRGFEEELILQWLEENDFDLSL